MKANHIKYIEILLITLIIAGCTNKPSYTQNNQAEKDLDKQVSEFLESKGYGWRDMNVPASDGKLLYDIVIKNNYKNAVEIGTSTGHSGIWIAWALSKTGGKLITIEVDEERHKEALENFKRAGVDKYIDARLADAHDLVNKLSGPIDFVFSDADKDWNVNYFKALDPKIVPGGCFVTHNIGMYGGSAYLNYVNKLPDYKTTIDNHGAGMAISYKTVNH